MAYENVNVDSINIYTLVVPITVCFKEELCPSLKNYSKETSINVCFYFYKFYLFKIFITIYIFFFVSPVGGFAEIYSTFPFFAASAALEINGQETVAPLHS